MLIDSDRCVKMKGLGFTSSMQINLYGQRVVIVSEPFVEGDGISVRATSGSDPEVRTLRLPVSILIGRTDRFLLSKSNRALKRATDAAPSPLPQ